MCPLWCAFKGNLIAGVFRVAQRIAATQKTAFFSMQNKPVFDVRKSTATSRETQGETGFRSEPRTTVVAQKYCIPFFPRPPRRIFPKNEQERSKVRFFQGVNLFAKYTVFSQTNERFLMGGWGKKKPILLSQYGSSWLRPGTHFPMSFP